MNFRYIYRNELGKVYFQHEIAYGGFKYLPRRATTDKSLHGKAFKIASNPKYDGYQRELVSIIYKFFD